jgi:hypothetical protein
MEIRVHGSTDLFRLSFPVAIQLLPHFFFMSCSHLISLLCFNLLSDTIFRTATPCTHQIWCGQHDRVCDVVHFDLHQHFGSLFAYHDLRTDTKSRTHCAGVSESRRTYRSDYNSLKSASVGKDRIDLRRRKIANRYSPHSLSQVLCREARDLQSGGRVYVVCGRSKAAQRAFVMRTV